MRGGWTALRLARRSLARGGYGLALVYAVLVVAAAAMVAGPVTYRSLMESARAQARTMLGGDLLLEVTGRPLDAGELVTLLPAGARIATVAHLMTFARTGERAVTVSLEAVDADWPLVGRLETDPPEAATRLHREPVAVAEPALLARLGLEPGDTFMIGPRRFRLAGELRRQPDRLAGGLALGPRVLVARRFLEDTPLLGPEAFIRWRHAVVLPRTSEPAAVAAAIRARAPEARFRVRTAEELVPQIARLGARLGGFAALVALVLLALGALALHVALMALARLRRHEVAVLRALGAEGRTIDRWLVLEAALLLAAALGPGLLLGVLLPALGLSLAAPWLPLTISLQLRAGDLLLPLGVVVAVALAALLPPLAACRRASPAGLFRTLAGDPPGAPRTVRLAAAGLVLAAGGLVVATLPERRLGLLLAAGLMAALAILALAGRGLLRLAARLADGSGRARLVLAARTLARGGAGVRAPVLALGLAIALATTTLALGERLRRELVERLPARAASLFLIDIRPDQRAELARLLARHQARLLQEAPVVRARVVAIKGVPAEEAPVADDVRWTLRADRVLTWRREALADQRLLAGAWWPPDDRGPLKVAVEARVARGYGLEIGDSLTFNILGRTLTARVAAIRAPVDWTRGRLDFVFVLSPGPLAQAPHSWIAAVEVTPAKEPALLAALARRLPGVSAVPLREVVARVREVVDQGARILLLAGVLVVAAALVVVATGIRASEAERRPQLLILRALGATRGELVALELATFSVLGLVAAACGVLVGALLAAAIAGRVFHLEPDFAAWTLLGPAGLALVLPALAGTLSTRRLLRLPVGRLFAAG